MATVFLTAGELKGERPLPRRCLVCGASGAKLVETRFALHAANRWSLGTGSVAVMRYLTTRLPLCRAHQAHFTSKGWMALYAFGAVFALFVVLLAVSVLAAVTLGAKAVYVILPTFFLAFLGMFGFIGYMVYTSESGVHPRKIVREGMQLANVADDFVEALGALREEAGDQPDDSVIEEFSEEGSTRRLSRRTRDDDDEEDEPRLRRRR